MVEIADKGKINTLDICLSYNKKTRQDASHLGIQTSCLSPFGLGLKEEDSRGGWG